MSSFGISELKGVLDRAEIPSTVQVVSGVSKIDIPINIEGLESSSIQSVLEMIFLVREAGGCTRVQASYPRMTNTRICLGFHHVLSYASCIL